MRRTIQMALLAGVFAAGFVCGTLDQRPVHAQMGGLGEKLEKSAGEGSLGSVGKLGASIIDMQKNVDSLQKNLDTLKQIKSALGG